MKHVEVENKVNSGWATDSYLVTEKGFSFMNWNVLNCCGKVLPITGILSCLSKFVSDLNVVPVPVNTSYPS